MRQLIFCWILLWAAATVMPSEVAAQQRMEKRKFFWHKKRSSLFSRKTRCPRLDVSKSGQPKLSKRERRKLEARNSQITQSVNQKIWAEELQKLAEEKRDQSPPASMTGSETTVMEVFSLERASVSPPPITKTETPVKKTPPPESSTVSTPTPLPAAAPTTEKKKTPEKRKGAAWFVSDTPITEAMETFTFGSDEEEFGEPDKKLMEKLARQYRYGFLIYLVEQLNKADMDSGRVMTYRRMNRIKTLLVANYGVDSDAIFLTQASPTNAPSSISIELK
ncbi:MAG: hypothetical protein ACFCUI_02795 [Bernardetiaceae bacterium]